MLDGREDSRSRRAARSRQNALLVACALLALACKSKQGTAPYMAFDQGDAADQAGDGGGATSGDGGNAVVDLGSVASIEQQTMDLQGWGATSSDPDKICGAQNFTCAITKTGAVRCWGQIAPVPANLPKATQIACGDGHACVLGDDATIACWGVGSGSPMGTPGSMSDLGQASPPAGMFKQVSAGGVHSCAIKMDDTVVCWGGGAKDKQNDIQPNFSQAIPPKGRFAQVSCGQAHTCAVTVNGQVMCWGAGTTSDFCSPPDQYDCGQAAPNDSTNQWAKVASGDMHSCALTTDGTIRCWGRGTSNDNCNVDSGANQYDCGQSLPATAMEPFIRVASGWEYSCAITQSHEMKCWGWNQYQMTTPPKGLYSQMGLGDTHGCAITLGGKVVCWGGAASGAAKVPAGVP